MQFTTKKGFEAFFRKNRLPTIKDVEKLCGGNVDKPLRREEWNNIIDTLVQEKHLPKRAIEWDCPW